MSVINLSVTIFVQGLIQIDSLVQSILVTNKWNCYKQMKLLQTYGLKSYGQMTLSNTIANCNHQMPLSKPEFNAISAAAAGAEFNNKTTNVVGGRP